jgi:hypothetical protein
MMLSRKAAIRVLALVAAGGAVLGISQVASAATPPYEPDSTNQLGQILFYDAAGNLVTSGNINDDPNFKYAVATTDDPIAANTSATLYAYTPVNGQPPGNWTGEQLSGTTTFPAASPANVAAAGTHRPVVTQSTTALGALNLASYIADVPNTDTTTSYAGLYQLRIQTAGNTKYWAADISVNASNGNWTLQYPNQTFASTTTTLTATPASPQSAPAAAITLKATVTDNVAGTVTFTDTDSNTQVGTTQALPNTGGGNNFATVTIPAGLAAGTHHYSATFLPAAGGLVSGSNGALTYVVTGRPTATSLSVSGPPATVGDTTTLTSTASFTSGTGTPTGTITWKDGAVTIAGPTAVDAGGNAAAGPSAFGLAAGAHSIVAFFTPSDPSVASSQSAPVNFTLSPASGDPCSNVAAGTAPKPFPSDPRSNTCIDPQAFQVSVPRGNLFISTPYDGSDAAHTFDLGAMALDPSGLNLHVSKPFGAATHASPGSQGVTIIDTRSQGEGWTATVKSTDFTKSGGGLISACNLGFTGVTPDYVTGNALSPTHPITVADVPNGGAGAIAPGTAGCTATGLAGAGHTFASIASNGTGSVNVFGSMDLYAPTSTPAGTYTATVTFTIF